MQTKYHFFEKCTMIAIIAMSKIKKMEPTKISLCFLILNIIEFILF